MNIRGLVFLLVSWAIIIGITAYCFWQIFRAKKV